uniref:Uncharacterized protein n=1 Tax=Vitis vinifera TaxID=29760 RepID=A5BI49_VITVI|nr:hypothetical protein VITISV_002215 [Vitis vinifera]
MAVQFRRRYGVVPSQATPSRRRFGATVVGVPDWWSPSFRHRSEALFSGAVAGLLATPLSMSLGIGVEDAILASSPIGDVVPLPVSFEDCSGAVLALLMMRLQGTYGPICMSLFT